MTLTPRKVLVALVTVAAAAGVWALRVGPAPAKVEFPEYQHPPARGAEELKKTPVGMAGCLAAACHGGPADKTLAGEINGTTWQSSGTCWAAADPHVNAYSVLESSLADRIMEHYAKGTVATEDARCVACHTNPALAHADQWSKPKAVALRSEGVSCEACHGNAGKWVNDHTTWKGDRDKAYEETGMARLYDLGERAKNCLGCHVGAPADENRGIPVRDMNHDMIAAGHPRLNFDFAEFVRRLPKHWQDKDRAANKERKLNPAKEWLVGRVAHAEAACALLQDRAERAEKGDEKTPWPEYSEFNCAACHHHLSVDAQGAEHANWRRTPAYLGDRPAGSIPWQMVWPMTNAPGVAKPERKQSELSPVLVEMEKPRPTTPARARKVAGETLGKLHQLRLSVVGKTDADVEREARAFFPKGPPRVPEWDTATQLFFGYAAMDRAGKPAESLVANYRQAAGVFRKQNVNQNQMPNWLEVEKAFKVIRPEN